jgi:uncharacterized protein involved in type VI secretion and phage assembly
MTPNVPQDVSALNKQRLSDRILYALALAIEQEDVKTADALSKAMELSMTRNSGGGQFVERREYPKYIEDMMTRLKTLKKQYGY